MVVKGISWLGVRTDRYDQMRAFAIDTLGLQLVSESDDFLVTRASNGDLFEVFGPRGEQPSWQFSRNPVVAGFLVDDIEAARGELASAPGVELLGDLQVMENGYAWQHFRAPDGHVYELTFDPDA
jgi:catechol 2,3-dioxygenase-like lactoylglutathione lyase family enzyme